jgi:type IV pilus assembly protein PilA
MQRIMSAQRKQQRTGRTSRRARGFSLIELVIVVAIILIIAAIAIPNLIRSKMAANEASAAGSLRTIATSAITYSSTYGDGFPADLPTLGGPAGTKLATCDHALMIDSVLSTSPFVKNGYALAYQGTSPAASKPTGCSAEGWNEFTATAVPVSTGQTGQGGFFVDQSGVIRFTTDGTTPSNSSPALP